MKFSLHNVGKSDWTEYPVLKVDTKDIDWDDENVFNDFGLTLDIWCSAFNCGVRTLANPFSQKEWNVFEALKAWAAQKKGSFLFGVKTQEEFYVPRELRQAGNVVFAPAWVEIVFLPENSDKISLIFEGTYQNTVSIPILNRTSVAIQMRCYSPH